MNEQVSRLAKSAVVQDVTVFRLILGKRVKWAITRQITAQLWLHVMFLSVLNSEFLENITWLTFEISTKMQRKISNHLFLKHAIIIFRYNSY